MRGAMAILVCGLMAVPALCGVTSTMTLESWPEVQQHVTGGFEFFARGDTDHVRLTQANPLTVQETPYDLWVSGVERGFKVTYNFMGIPAGIEIDDVQSIFESTIPISPDTHHLLVTAWIPSGDPGRSPTEVSLTNLKLTLPDLTIHDVGASLVTNGSDRYLLIETDVNLQGGFMLSGSVALTWSGGELAAPQDQWFEVSPVLVPEPSTLVTLVGSLAIALLRRR